MNDWTLNQDAYNLRQDNLFPAEAVRNNVQFSNQVWDAISVPIFSIVLTGLRRCIIQSLIRESHIYG